MRRLILFLLPLLLLPGPAAAQGAPFPVADPAALAAGLQRHFQDALTVQEVRRFGADAVVLVEFAQRANSLEQWLVVARNTRVIAVQDAADGLARSVQTGLAATYPRAMLDVGRQGFLRRVARAEGGQRFVFALPIVDGCRACALIGVARIALDVDAAGTYRGARSLGAVPFSGGGDWRNAPRL